MLIDIIMHYDLNPETQVMTYIGQDKVTVDTNQPSKPKKAKVSSTIPKPDSLEPKVVRDLNKLILNEAAITKLGCTAGCRIDVKYDTKDGKQIPIIGTSTAFGVDSGNKLTNGGTVSFRGEVNTTLAAFGQEFILEESDKEGIFYMVGDITPIETPNDLVDLDLELKSIQSDIEQAADTLDEINNFDFNF